MFTLLIALAFADPPTAEDPETTLPSDVSTPRAPDAGHDAVRRGPDVAVELGAGIPTGGYGLSGLLRVSGGYRLPTLDGRLRPYVAVGYTGPRAAGSVAEEGRPDLDFQLRDHQWILSPGVDVRLLGASASTTAELDVAPELVFATIVERASRDGVPAGLVTETRVSPGVSAGVGVASQLGPGEIVARAGVRWVGTKSVLTGRNGSVTLLLVVGYRYAL